MKKQPRSDREMPPGLLGDDWLTRDPESFGDRVEEAGAQRPPGPSWRQIVEDALLYGAGITTGLLVVAAAWLLLQLAAPPGAVDGTSPKTGTEDTVERVARK